MPKFTIYISHTNLNNENWVLARGITSKGQRFQGYGTTNTNAMLDAFRDLAIIIKLNKNK